MVLEVMQVTDNKAVVKVVPLVPPVLWGLHTCEVSLIQEASKFGNHYYFEQSTFTTVKFVCQTRTPPCLCRFK